MGKTFIVVAGANKSGTSSIFEYLMAHPQVVTTIQKQANYFLSKDYSLSKHNAKFYYEEDLGQSYEKLFATPGNLTTCWVDISPDYMYCDKTAEYMKTYFCGKQVKVVFVLRDPIERLVSWFKFGKQMQLIDKDVQFSDYLNAQSSHVNNSMAYSALETGKFVQYINRYKSAFPEGKLIFCDYAALNRNPRSFMQSLADKLSLERSFYDEFEFKKYNVSAVVKNRRLHSAYLYIQRMTHRILSTNEKAARLLRPLLSKVSGFYRVSNLSSSADVVVDEKTRMFLQEIYQAEFEVLKNIQLSTG